jgi:chemotaxis protein histidine kinase CheA
MQNDECRINQARKIPTPDTVQPDTSLLAPPRATLAESPFSSWIGSLFTPSAAAADSQAESSDGILWGAGALAAMAGMTAYYEQKRREEQEAKRAALQAQASAAEQAEKERQQKAQAKAMAKLEQQWAEERRKEQAYLQWKAEQEQRPDSHRGQDAKLEREENKEAAAWETWKDRSQLLAAQRAEAERQKQADAEKQKQAREDANRAYAALREKGQSISVAAPKDNKSWLNSFLDSAKERTTQTIFSGRDWLNRAAGAIPDGLRVALLWPVQITQKANKKFLFPVIQSRLDDLAGLAAKVKLDIPRDQTAYRKFLLDEIGLNTFLSSVQKRHGISATNLKQKIWDAFVLGGKATAKEAGEKVAESSLRQTLKAVSPSVVDVGIESVFNAYDYTFGENKDKGIFSHEFAVSTGVDVVGSVVIGLAAAALAVAIAPVSAPVLGVALLAIGLGMIGDIALEATGVKDLAKDGINSLIDSMQATQQSQSNPAQTITLPTPSQTPPPEMLSQPQFTPQPFQAQPVETPPAPEKTGTPEP